MLHFVSGSDDEDRSAEYGDLPLRDRAFIVLSLSAREPENPFLYGIAAYYLECAGVIDAAEFFYGKAGRSVADQFAAFLMWTDHPHKTDSRCEKAPGGPWRSGHSVERNVCLPSSKRSLKPGQSGQFPDLVKCLSSGRGGIGPRVGRAPGKGIAGIGEILAVRAPPGGCSFELDPIQLQLSLGLHH